MKWMFLKLSSLYLHNACFPLCSLLHCAVVMVSKSCTSLRRMVFCALTVVVWRVFLMTPFVAQKPKIGLLLMLTSRNVLYIVCSLLFTINASTEILFFPLSRSPWKVYLLCHCSLKRTFTFEYLVYLWS